MTTRAAQALSRPLTVGGLTLPNRIAMAPVTRFHAPDGIPGADMAAYYARRAAGGVGLIFTEGAYIGHPSSGQDDRVSRIYGDEPQAGWSRTVEAVHDAGGLIALQLQHVGMMRKVGEPPHPGAPPVGPSGLSVDGTSDTRIPMSQKDIDDAVQAFADAASTAERIGFDGMELHGAHGYLIDQFLWSVTNQRTDSCGGDLRSRTRFAAEVVAAVRSRVSPGFPIIVRLSQWKTGVYDARIAESPQEFEVIVGALADAGADAFHASTRRYWEPAFEGSELNLAGWAKKLAGKAAITVGSVGLDTEFMASLSGEVATKTGIDGLLGRLEADEFDVVAVGRSLIGDPDWAAKVLAGREDDIVGFTPEALGALV